MTSWLGRLTQGLKKTSQKISTSLGLGGRKLDAALLEEIEESLIGADMGIQVSASFIEKLKEKAWDKEVTEDQVKAWLAEEIASVLKPVMKPFSVDPSLKPHVILVVGMNGSGKTTTLGKLAYQWHQAGLQVSVAAGDTFRAAATEQLQHWGERVGVPVVAGEAGSDPAGLAYEAYEKARTRGDDVLLIDTAGRLHTNVNLMAELSKIARVLGKIDSQAPHTCLLILDSTLGQNAVSQVETFKKAVNVNGLVMTKLDGTAKGGIVVQLAEKFQIPLHGLGVGEGPEDLQPFDADSFARALVGLSPSS